MERLAKGGGRDLTMKTALYVAGIIHHDLCIANASAWHWWLGVSNSNYKDGLVYADFNRTMEDAEVIDSRLLWTLGNFSRFVRPGSIRMGVSCSEAEVDDLDGVMVSAYMNKEDKTLVTVMINTLDKSQSIILRLSSKVALQNKGLFITSDREGDKLKRYKELNPLDGCEVPARSVSTWIAGW